MGGLRVPEQSIRIRVLTVGVERAIFVGGILYPNSQSGSGYLHLEWKEPFLWVVYCTRTVHQDPGTHTSCGKSHFCGWYTLPEQSVSIRVLTLRVERAILWVVYLTRTFNQDPGTHTSGGKSNFCGWCTVPEQSIRIRVLTPRLERAIFVGGILYPNCQSGSGYSHFGWKMPFLRVVYCTRTVNQDPGTHTLGGKSHFCVIYSTRIVNLGPVTNILGGKS